MPISFFILSANNTRGTFNPSGYLRHHLTWTYVRNQKLTPFEMGWKQQLESTIASVFPEKRTFMSAWDEMVITALSRVFLQLTNNKQQKQRKSSE